MRRKIKKNPFITRVTKRIYHVLFKSSKPFENSASYWESRYKSGGNSGGGSYSKLAEFKANLLNAFVVENKISSVIEYGCGDGNQLSLARYPKYTGFDVSSEAVSMCSNLFSADKTKIFKELKDYDGETAELTLSLDVIYHLVEDVVFTSHMERLFDSSERFVIIYSSNTSENPKDTLAHVKHRSFSEWITTNRPEWKLMKHIPNKYPFNSVTRTGSLADFYIYSG